MGQIINQMMSPQNYLEIMTGETFIINGDDDNKLSKNVLRQRGIRAKSYDFDDISGLVNATGQYVLVDAIADDNVGMYHAYRWWQIPDDYHGHVDYVEYPV